MAEWHFGFTALRIAKLFLDSTTQKHCCADITRKLTVPQQTVWQALQYLKEADIIESEKEWIPKKRERVLYCLTESGFDISMHALAAVQRNEHVNGGTIHFS